MRYRRTYRAPLIRPHSPLTTKDMIKREAQLDDEYLHRMNRDYPLPKNTLLERAEMTYTALYAISWDMGRKTWKKLPNLLEALKMVLP